MKVLVTGCFGFIGFNFVNFLHDKYGKEIQIYGIDKLTNDYSKKNSQNFSNIVFFKNDINNIQDIDELKFKNLDAIFNFAAETHVDTSIYNPNEFISSNVLGVSNLLQYALKNEVKSFIHISTDEVYGSSESNFSKENDKFLPSSPYSASKASAEHIVNSFRRTFGINTKIVRPANNFGKYQQPEKLIPFSIANLISGGDIEIYGDGKNIRHWLYVDDTCSAIETIYLDGQDGEAYNIGSENYFTNIEISDLILKFMNLDKTKQRFVQDRPGHDFRYAINIDKISNLGWRPNTDFDNQLKETIEWYIQNQKWWQESFDKILLNRKKRLSLEK